MEKSIKSPGNTANTMKLKQICLNRSKKTILHNLTAELPGTGVTVLLGANGAGKSSLLNVMAGISDVSSGELESEKNTGVCLMPEPAIFYPQLSVVEQLRFVAELYDPGFNPMHIESALDIWQLQSVRDQLTQHLSLGYRQRLSLAQLTVSDADLWLLDEPMNGMDPEVLSVFKQQIKLNKVNKAIVMATHIMHEAQELADWVVVMHQGQIMHSAPYDGQTSFHVLYQQTLESYHQSLAPKSTTIKP